MGTMKAFLKPTYNSSYVGPIRGLTIFGRKSFSIFVGKRSLTLRKECHKIEIVRIHAGLFCDDCFVGLFNAKNLKMISINPIVLGNIII